MKSSEYIYKKMVQFYDTDLMGVVHHANYLKFFEEARVDWLRWSGLQEFHYPFCDRLLAVTSSEVYHGAPSRFGDLLEIKLEVRVQRLKIEFQYVIYSQHQPQPVAWGRTFHVMVDESLKPRRPEKRFIEALEKEVWTETWP